MHLIQTALILAMSGLAFGFCPHDKIQNIGNCSYRIQCVKEIRGIRLPNQCMESTNDPVTIDLTLTDADDSLDQHIDRDFLGFLTTLRISGNWPNTQLALLQYTTRLENLFLVGSHIESIGGTPFYTLNSLEILDLSHNKLTEIDHLFHFELQPNKLSKLYLPHNKIQRVPKSAFDELTYLTELDLSNNFISDVTEEPFSNLSSIEVLKLNNNRITNLNGAVNNLHNLKHLYLRGNQIDNIDEKSLNIITHLETFDVSSNHLEKITSVMLLRHWKHLGNQAAACKINLSGNHITSVPNATAKEITIRYVRHVLAPKRRVNYVATELDLSNNQVSNIEYNAFQSLIQLISLDLSNNKLADFKVDPEDVAHVRFLNLSGNFIINVYYESFSQMKGMQTLDLSFNKLENIPEEAFRNISNLKYLNINNNAIENVENMHMGMFHRDGGILDLSNNGLSKLSIPHGDGLHLTYLKLHSNNISDPALIDLYYQTGLKSLDLSHNKIRELHENSLRLPVSLSSLDLSFNQISQIAPSSFLRIWHLRVLRLAHNKINSIEYGTFRGLASLSKLDLSFNQIRMVDSKVLIDLKYLSLLYLQYNRLNEIYDDGWFGHKHDLAVYLDGNNLTCEWLVGALKNHDNGYTKMRPTVQNWAHGGQTVEGIPCTSSGSKLAKIITPSAGVMITDERLLMTSQKILEAVREQTYYMKKYIWRSIQDDAEKVKSFS